MTRPSEPDWHTAPPSGRRATLLRAMRRLYELRPGPARIVETRTLRSEEGRDGDGWSTLAWGWYCSQTGGTLYTVDSDPEALAVSRRLSAPYAPWIRYVRSDSVACLHCWPFVHSPSDPPTPGLPDPQSGYPRERVIRNPQSVIDLLYLDSLDALGPGSEFTAGPHHAEAAAALRSLARPSVVLLVDTHPTGEPDAAGVPPFSGKGALVVPFLVERGFRLEWYVDGQVLLTLGASPEDGDHHHFRFQERLYPYFEHSINGGRANERTVEVALALPLLETARGPVLEVGNVLTQHGYGGHTVVDRYEAAEGVLNVDIADFDDGVRYGLILSISTLEHVGWDEQPRDSTKISRVLDRLLRHLLAPGGRFFATVPMGHNPHLDRLLLENQTGTELAFLRRLDAAGHWRPVPRAELGEPLYNHLFPMGNVVAVLSA